MIELADEPPVRELMLVAVHRESVTSDIFLSAIFESCRTENLTKRPVFVKRLLQCLEGSHQLQTGRLLVILVPTFLKSKNLALSRMAAKVASRRVEMLLTLGNKEVLAQLSRENFKVFNIKVLYFILTENKFGENIFIGSDGWNEKRRCGKKTQCTSRIIK